MRRHRGKLRGFGWILLGIISLAIGPITAAAADDDPAEVRRTALGFFQQQEYDAAIRHYDRAIELDATNPANFRERGTCQSRLGRFDRAIRDLDTAIRLDPDTAHAYIERAHALTQTGEPAKAIADCDEAIRLDRDNVKNYLYRGVAYVGLANHAAAIADLTRVIDQAPETASAWQWRAFARAYQEDNRGAISDLNEAIRLEPNSGLVYCSRANVLSEINETARAIADYRRSLELDPRNTEARNALAYLLSDELQLKEAIQLLDAGIDLDPDSTTLLATRSQVFAIRYLSHWGTNPADLAHAVADADRASALAPTEKAVLCSQIIVHLIQCDFARVVEDASAVIRTADDDDDDDFDVLFYRATALVLLGEHRRAAEDGVALLELVTGSKLDGCRRVVAAFEPVNIAAAIGRLDALVQDDPRNVANLTRRGWFWLAQGDPSHAQTDFAAALALDPQNPDAARGQAVARRLAR